MDNTQYLIRTLEDALDAKPLNHRACNLLCTLVETLFQKGLIDRHVIHSICDSGWSSKWGAFHEFVKLNQGAIEKLREPTNS